MGAQANGTFSGRGTKGPAGPYLQPWAPHSFQSLSGQSPRVSTIRFVEVANFHRRTSLHRKPWFRRHEVKLADTGEKKTARIWHRLDMFDMFDMFDILQLRKWHKLHKLHKLHKHAPGISRIQEAKASPAGAGGGLARRLRITSFVWTGHRCTQHTVPYDPCSLLGRLGATINYQNSSKHQEFP